MFWISGWLLEVVSHGDLSVCMKLYFIFQTDLHIKVKNNYFDGVLLKEILTAIWERIIVNYPHDSGL